MARRTRTDSNRLIRQPVLQDDTERLRKIIKAANIKPAQ